jgi:hypothetical protein
MKQREVGLDKRISNGIDFVLLRCGIALVSSILTQQHSKGRGARDLKPLDSVSASPLISCFPLLPEAPVLFTILLLGFIYRAGGRKIPASRRL